MATTSTERNIKTSFYNGRNVVKTNTAMDVNKAIAQCVYYMQCGFYAGATSAEVFDVVTGEQYAAVKRHATGRITIVYQYDPASYERRLSLATFE